MIFNFLKLFQVITNRNCYILVCPIIFFAAFITTPSYSENNKIDSLSNALKNVGISDSEKVNIYLKLGSEEKQNENISKSLDYYLKAIELAEACHDSIKLYSAYQKTAQLHGVYLRFDKSIEYKTKALKLSEAMGDPHYIADARMNIGIEYYSQKNYPQAIQEFESALRYCKNRKEALLDGTLTYLIALSYLRMENFSKSRTYFDIAYQKINASGNTSRLMDCLVGMSEMQLAIGNADTAIILLDKVIMMTDSILPGTGSPQRGYLLAKAYLKKGDLQKAEESGLCSMDYYAMPGTSKYDFAEVTKVMAEIYEAKGDFQKALTYRKQYQAINDSVTSAGNQYKINTLLSGIQLDKKNQEIELLSRDKEIQSLWRKALQAGFILLIIIVLLIFRNFYIQRAARKKSDLLLLNILPEVVVEELKQIGFAKAKKFENVTVLFTDFKNFSSMAEKLSAEELVAELNICFTAFDRIMMKYSIEKIKTVGDAYLAVSGMPNADEKHAYKMAIAAIEIRDFMLNRSAKLGDTTFEVRLGLNSGSAVAGIVGMNKFAYDIWGDTVNIAARMEQCSEPGKINISESTYLEIKEIASCTYRGMIEAKNKGEINMYFLNGFIDTN